MEIRILGSNVEKPKRDNWELQVKGVKSNHRLLKGDGEGSTGKIRSLLNSRNG